MSEETIESEVSGTVWKIEVKAGESIEEEDVIMILESMKMEIPALAPCDCEVIELLVSEGEAITEGQSLARIRRSA